MSLPWAEPPVSSLFADEQVLLEVDPGYAGPGVYAPRRPQQTVLYKLVQDNLETWLATRREACLDDDPIPTHVEKAFRNYLLCGIWAAGLVKYVCPDGCDHAVCVALSCRTRGLCPSCGAKSMAITAMHLEQHVLPRVGFRQWVISFPKRVRYFLQHDSRRFRSVLRICMRAIESAIRAGCPDAPAEARVVAVLLSQGFGASLNVHHHGHFIVSEGVYSLDDAGGRTFDERVDPLDDKAIAALSETIRKRVLRHLVRKDRLDADDAAQMLSWQHHGGFSLDASVYIAHWDRAGLQQLSRTCARHPLAKGRLQRAGPQRVLYQLPKPDLNGNSPIVLDPLELLDRLAELIVPPRHHRHTYWGALAPPSALRPLVVLEAGADNDTDDVDGEGVDHQAPGQTDPPPAVVAGLLCQGQPAGTGSAAKPKQRPGPGSLVSLWAIMLAQVYEVLPIICPKCGAEMKPVAVIVDPDSLKRICQHQGQPPAIPKLAPARDPPQRHLDFH
jgi:hypothetical protein